LVVIAWTDRDKLHRTAKLLFDSKRAATPEDAEALLRQLVLQISVGPGLRDAPAAQAALCTAINAGRRAFLGGVVVSIEDDPVLTEGWVSGVRLSTAIAHFGGKVAASIKGNHPTIVIGKPRSHAVGSIILMATWHGWSGGLVENDADRLSEQGSVIAGVVCGSLGVSECFQHVLHAAAPGRRAVGVSLWKPGCDWTSTEAAGPAVRWLPNDLWLLGLGHLGQGYSWSLGWLPYGNPHDARIYLLDTDAIVEGNGATDLLSQRDHIGRYKTRVISEQLESLGLRTAIIERRFGSDLHPTGQEPRIALAGFDDPVPRRILDEQGFLRVVDAGIGGGPHDYLDILIHTFPSLSPSREAFPESVRPRTPIPPAYETAIAQLISDGMSESEATCGVIEIAGVSIGAAFVGASAGALGVADLLRSLHGGPEYSVLNLDLANPAYLTTAAAAERPVLPGFVSSR
jgi:hypothetical protein